MIAFPADRRFLITGASAGIGRSIAHTLNGLGATVIGVGRNANRLEEARSSAPEPARFHIEQRDLSEDMAGLAGWIRRIAARLGPLRGLLHSAGAVELAPLKFVSLPAARRLFDVNFFSGLLLAQGFCEDGVNDGPGSSIVFVSSGSSLRGLAAASTYSATKGALNAAARSLARELAPKGIRVNTILPGLVDTPMTQSVPEEQIRFILGLQFLPGSIGPEEIAFASAFVVSDEGRFMTGESVTVDAGSGMKVQPVPGTDGAIA
jgi:NAD(P)-dependent dehydrogenase (short-subunit alcohol dehydrogenase family)